MDFIALVLEFYCDGCYGIVVSCLYRDFIGFNVRFYFVAFGFDVRGCVRFEGDVIAMRTVLLTAIVPFYWTVIRFARLQLKLFLAPDKTTGLFDVLPL